MKINLTICGVKELDEQSGKPWTHVVSIWDKAHLYDTACRERVQALAPQAELLFTFFDDTSDPNYPDGPKRRDVQRILDFTASLTPKHKVLVHCLAGISRSTATAYAILCQHSRPGTELENLFKIESMRPLVMPNRLVMQHADKILRRNGGMLMHLNLDD